MKKILYVLYSLCAIAVLALAQGAPPITFKEIDGSPKKTAPTTIRVSNGTLTCSGSVCTITTGGGSPGGANTQVQYNNNGALGGINTFTYDGNRVTFGANPLFNVGSTGTDNLIYVGSTSSGAVNASFGFFVAGVGSQQASDGPYFLGRGNSFSNIANQHGMLYFGAGDPGVANGNDGNILFATGADVVRVIVRRDGYLQLVAFTLSQLGGPPDGSMAYCSDCAVGTDPCTGSSTGAFAYRLNSRWYCP
jgi:hypothetical protein